LDGSISECIAAVGVEVSLDEPQPLGAGVVCRAWQQWYLVSLHGVDPRHTKTHHYVHTVRGGSLTEYGPPRYLAEIPERRRRRSLTQLRTGSHWLREETGRWQQVERQDLLCPHCLVNGVDVVEDRHHFLFECTSMADLRQHYPQHFPLRLLDENSFFDQEHQRAIASFANQGWYRHYQLWQQSRLIR